MVWVGTAAIMAMEASYLPQIVRLYRLKRAEEMSLLFPLLNLSGRILALTYSVVTGEHVFTVGFCIGALLRATLLLEVLLYRRRPEASVGLPEPTAMATGSLP